MIDGVKSLTRYGGVIAAMLGATACGTADDGGTPGVTDSTITLGTWAPLTGPAALWGAVGRGVDAYFKMVNEEGGIHGRTFEVILRDDGYQPSRTVPAVREMVERDRVFAVIAGVGTAPGMAVKDYLAEQGVPWITPATGNTGFTHPPSPNLYTVFTPYADEAAALVNYALDSLGLERFGVIYQNDDFGKSGLVGVRLTLQRRGLEPVAEVPTEPTDSDLSSHVLRVSEANADAVLMWVTPRHAAIIRGAAARMDFQPQWLASTVVGDVDLMYEITDGLWEGTIGALTIDMTDSADPRLARYREAQQAYYPDEGSVYFLMAGFAYAEAAGEAFRRAGRDLTREGFLEAMQSLEDFEGLLSPPSSFGPGQHLGTRLASLYRVDAEGVVTRLTDWVEPTLDLEEAHQKLMGGG